MRFLYYTWNEIEDLCFKLAKLIKTANFSPEIIIAVSRGGLIPARIIADYFNTSNLASLKIEYYAGIGKRREQPLVKYADIDIKDKSVLVIDDIADTGNSLIALKKILDKKQPKVIKIATLHYKEHSKFTPDFYALVTDAWIIYPWEKVEAIEELKKAKKKEHWENQKINQFLREIGFEEKDLKIVDFFLK